MNTKVAGLACLIAFVLIAVLVLNRSATRKIEATRPVDDGLAANVHREPALGLQPGQETPLSRESPQVGLAQDLITPSARIAREQHPLFGNDASITVQVFSARSGGLVSGASVYLQDYASVGLLELRTDHTGRVLFENLSAGAKALSVERGGVLGVDLGNREEKSVRMEIPLGLSVGVQVTDAVGTGIPNAAVFVSQRNDSKIGSVVAVTDKDGQCRIHDIARGRLLWVQADGYEPSYGQPVFEEKDVEIKLPRPGFSLAGKVVDAESGLGLPNAWVQVDGFNAPGSIRLADGSAMVYAPPPPPIARTDASGLFQIPVSDRSGLVITATASGFAAQRMDVDRAIRSERYVELALERADQIYGFVVDEEGAAVGHARLELHTQPETSTIRVNAEADGSFRIPNVPRRGALLRARAVDGYTGELTLGPDEVHNDVVILVVSNADSVRLRVQTISGAPVPGCRLVRLADPVGPLAFLTLHRIGTTDSEGECRVDRARLAGGCSVGLFLAGVDPSFPFATANWEGAGNEVLFTLQGIDSPGSLEFSFLDEVLGNTLGEVASTVFVFDQGSERWLGYRVDDKGSCAFRGLAEGIYESVLSIDGDFFELGTHDLAPGEKRLIEVNSAKLAGLQLTKRPEFP